MILHSFSKKWGGIVKKIKIVFVFLLVTSLLSFSLFLLKNLNSRDNVKAEELVVEETNYVF